MPGTISPLRAFLHLRSDEKNVGRRYPETSTLFSLKERYVLFKALRRTNVIGRCDGFWLRIALAPRITPIGRYTW
jgi:hypothetical protein